MANKLNALSPYIVYWAKTNLTRVDIDIFVYSGTQTTDRPATATYSLTADAYNEEITFDLAVLVADYFTNSFNNDYASNSLWVDYEITEWISGSEQTAEAIVPLVAFYGYGYFDEGTNPELTSGVLLCNTNIYIPTGTEPIIPISTGDAVGVEFFDSGSLLAFAAITESTESSSYIDYVSPTLEWLSEKDGATYEGNPCIDAFELEFPSGVTDIGVSEGGGITNIKVNYVDECTYTPYKVTFLNKQGAYQDVWFYKRMDKNIKIKDRKGFRRNTLDAGIFSTNQHQYKNFRVNARESISLNTGFTTESFNCVFEQLTLSEDVWIRWEGRTLPINITEDSFKYKTILNDNLIQYKMSFVFAFDKINSVR